MAVFGAPIACARIYVGVHFPFDMFGSVAVAALSAWLTLRAAGWYPLPSYRLATCIHHVLFSKLIAQGWVRK